MVDDSNFLNVALIELGELMATKLKSKGITNAKASDGLTTLANKILDISGGLELETNVDILFNNNDDDDDSPFDDFINVPCELKAFFDDVSSSDVDLVGGYLKGATIKIMEGDGVLGTATTNNEGIAAIPVHFSTCGVHNIKAVFEGNDYYKKCESTIMPITIFESVVEMEFVGNNVTIGYQRFNWLYSYTDVLIEWGDGTSELINDTTIPLVHNYNDGLDEHNIRFKGAINSLGDFCFRTCNLTSINIPNTVKRLGEFCFYGCNSLKNISIPESVESLGVHCFTGSGLTSIDLPSSITTIPNFCFLESKLTSINLPNGITNLGMYCFQNCRNLTSVVIPNSVISIGSGCFSYCSKLIDYQLYWTNDDIIPFSDVIFNMNSGTIFTIPQGQTNNYVTKGYSSDKLVERSS